jgi:hypothetical protein
MLAEAILALTLMHPHPSPTAEQWAALRMCESSNRTNAVSRTGKYRGLYQFDLPTWKSVGGKGDPARATRFEQYRRAVLLYNKRGWQPWYHCGEVAKNTTE